jgi:hypothetical protein
MLKSSFIVAWNLHGGINYIIIVKDNYHETAKTSAGYTYNKCMKYLQFGDIIYLPSSNPFTGSTVLRDF